MDIKSIKIDINSINLDPNPIRIIIIKLGAAGDVLRTIPILEAIKEKYSNSEIYWITKQDSFSLLENNPLINKIYTIPCKINENFDILYNFDIEEDATNFANEIKANQKFGFYNENGFPVSFNLGSEYYLNTLFDDYLKKSNKKTYQEMMFESAELEYKKQQPKLCFSEQDLDYAKNFVLKNNIQTEKLIGIHMGASSRWPSKAWSEEKIKEFIIKAKNKRYNILLFGGPEEKEKQKKLINELTQEGIIVHNNDPLNTKREFAALVNLCDKMVCADSLSLHVALALNKPTIGLFFCTSPNEVECYNCLTKIISPKLYDFFPEKSDQYNEDLVNSISVDEVLNALEFK